MASVTEPRQNYRQCQYNPIDQATHTKNLLPEKVAPSSSPFVALVILFPLAAFLLLLSGVTLTGTVIGLVVTTPLFVIFSPVLLPAAIVIGLAVSGFLTSIVFGVTALSSFAWLANYLRRSGWPEQLEQAKQRAQEMADHVYKRTEEEDEDVQSRAQESGEIVQNKAQESGPTVKTKAREAGKA